MGYGYNDGGKTGKSCTSKDTQHSEDGDHKSFPVHSTLQHSKDGGHESFPMPGTPVSDQARQRSRSPTIQTRATQPEEASFGGEEVPESEAKVLSEGICFD